MYKKRQTFDNNEIKNTDDRNYILVDFLWIQSLYSTVKPF